MPDFLGLMKQASELKSKMEAMQAELDRFEVEGTAGGGLVTLKISGKGDLRGVSVDDSLLKPDQKEIVEDLIVAAHAEGTVQRLRPKIMTVSIMAAGLLPLLWADGAGAEIMRRVAAPMLGGLVTSAFLTLEVLPVLYTIWRHRQLLRAQRNGGTIEAEVGAVPAWARWSSDRHGGV